MVHLQAPNKTLIVEATFQGHSSRCDLLVFEQKAYSLVLTSEGTTVQCLLVSVRPTRSNRQMSWIKLKPVV